jgi:hypothetical protein
MEYIEHGDLSFYLTQPLSEEEARTITFQLVEESCFSTPVCSSIEISSQRLVDPYTISVGLQPSNIKIT